MTTTHYKGCEITRTDVSTTRLRSNGGLRKWEVYVPLYEIEGRVRKAHGKRPFITSIAEAKEYITTELERRSGNG